MKQLSIIFVLLFISMATIEARTQEEALAYAKAFWASPVLQSPTRKTVSLDIRSAFTLVRNNSSAPAFYAFNRGENEGFVLVAADETIPAVIGYADKGCLDTNDIPDNLKAWLENYQRELDWLTEHPEDATTVKTTYSAEESVSPLLGNIKWNQSQPYNNLCPTDSAGNKMSAGCVATAVAQVMKYYQYPDTGVGSYSYTSKKRGYQLSARFDTVYQWSKMKNTYTTYTKDQAAAVALLMSHVGIASSMNYGSNGGTSSSAYPNMAGYALRTYFKYDRSIQLCYRDYYSGNWEQLIRTELLAKRPVVYTGYSATGGGHSFVCDGVNEQGYFHFNWGWGGSSNGYFLLTILNPSNQGIGGTGSSYCYSQNALIHLMPDQGGSTPEIAKYICSNFTADKTSFTQSESVTFTMSKLMNVSLDTIKRNNLSILFMQNSVVKYTIALKNATTSPATFYGTHTQACNTSTIADGTYEVALGYKESGYAKWRLVNSRGGTPYKYTLVVQGNTRTLTRQDQGDCVPEFCDLLYDEYLIAGKKATIKPLVYLASRYHNYRDSMHLVLQNVATKAIGYDSKAYYVDITAGTYDSTAITISKLPTAGDYRAYLYHAGKVDSLINLIPIYSTTPTALLYPQEQPQSIQKIIKDGQLLILRDNQIYTINGERTN